MGKLYLHPERDKAASAVASVLLKNKKVRALYLVPLPVESASFAGDYRILAIVDPALSELFNRACERPWSQYAGEGRGETIFDEVPATRQEIALALLDIGGVDRLFELLIESPEAIDLIKDGWAEIVLASPDWPREVEALSALRSQWSDKPPKPVYDSEDWPYAARFSRYFRADLVTFDPRLLARSIQAPALRCGAPLTLPRQHA